MADTDFIQGNAGRPLLVLKKGEERRLKSGHLWVFANEVDTKKSPLGDFEPGCECEVADSRGACLGTATVNPHSLICARIHSRSHEALDEALIESRLKTALETRKLLQPDPWFRLVHAEGDFLPGLVVDLFGGHATIQITTRAMEERRGAVADAVKRLLAPKSVFWDNTSPARAHEGLDLYAEADGPVPETLEVPENGCLFAAPLAEGQKTGWYYDQRDNRALMQRFARGRRVLDAFSYVGGFGVNAGHAGASSVTFVDASKRALEFARANLARNAGDTSVETLAGDGPEILKGLAESGERFDVVSIDPPAFIKRRKDFKEGLAAYRRLNEAAMKLLSDDGLLFTSSCSQLLPLSDLKSAVATAAARMRAHARILHTGFQGADHPVHASMPETAYLKCLVVAVSKGRSARGQ